MEQCSPSELKEAMKIYVERHGKGQVTLDKLEEIIRELKGEK
jgi:uncharacterized membrane protein